MPSGAKASAWTRRSFQALPEDCRLFARLQGGSKVGTLVARLFICGGGPYTWARLEDLDEILDGIAEDGPPFTSRQDADRAMKVLIEDLEQARAIHSGLEDRRAYLEKTQWDIEERLTRALERRGHPGAETFVWELLFGVTLLTPPEVRGFLGDGLRVVRAVGVAEAARVLPDVAPGSLFDEEQEEWLYEDFSMWRGLYLAAADEGRRSSWGID